AAVHAGRAATAPAHRNRSRPPPSSPRRPAPDTGLHKESPIGTFFLPLAGVRSRCSRLGLIEMPEMTEIGPRRPIRLTTGVCEGPQISMTVGVGRKADPPASPRRVLLAGASIGSIPDDASDLALRFAPTLHDRDWTREGGSMLKSPLWRWRPIPGVIVVLGCLSGIFQETLLGDSGISLTDPPARVTLREVPLTGPAVSGSAMIHEHLKAEHAFSGKWHWGSVEGLADG